MILETTLIQTKEKVRARCPFRLRDEHVRTGHHSLDEKSPQENCHRDTGRNAKGNGGDQASSQCGVVGCSWSQDPFDGTFAEPLLVG